MKLEYKADSERVLEYWRAYWAGEIIDRPVVCISAPKAPSAPPIPKYMDGIAGDFVDAANRYDNYAKGACFMGEMIPFMPISFGPDQFALFMGGEFTYAEETETSWIHPYVRNWQNIDFALDTKNGSYYERMLEYIRTARREGEGKFLVSMLDIHSNLDCLAAMRGPQSLCLDLYDCPEDVMAANKRVRELYESVYNSLFAAGEMEKTGSIGWAPFYCDGKFAVIQCDFMALIGNDDVRKYVIPALIEESSYLDHCLLHLDGKSALRHLDDILAIESIDAIQWVPGAGQPKTYEWMNLLKKIQAAGKGLHLYDWDEAAIKAYYHELRPEGVVFDLNVESESKAESLIKWLRDNT